MNASSNGPWCLDAGAGPESGGLAITGNDPTTNAYKPVSIRNNRAAT